MRLSSTVSAMLVLSLAVGHQDDHHEKNKEHTVFVTVTTTVEKELENSRVAEETDQPKMHKHIERGAGLELTSMVHPAGVMSASPAITSTFVTKTGILDARSMDMPSSSSMAMDQANCPVEESNSTGSISALGVVYSPYNADHSCKSSDEVSSDLSKLQSFAVIRIYGTDCDQVTNVYKAKSQSQKLFLGIFDVQANIQDTCSQIKNSINGDWDSIIVIGVGNELVNSGKANPGQVKQYVDQAKSSLQNLGYNGPVVSPETFIAVQNNPDLCNVSDVIAINAHAFYDPTCAASDAGNWILSTVQSVSMVCNNKTTLISESGWPTRGQPNGKAIPGTSEQQQALSGIMDSVGSDVILFTAFDDLWKDPGAFASEQSFGFVKS